MKKLPLILSVVSILAVLVFFVLEFTEKDNDENHLDGVETVSKSTGAIAYVDIDTIIYNFDMYFKLRDDLMKKQESSEAELNSKGSQYEAGAKDYEEKVRKGLVTRATAAQMEQVLIQQQQEIVNLRDQLQYALMEEEQVMNRSILDYIYKYLEVYNKDHNYEYILGKTFGGPVLLSDSGSNITAEVLKGLNEYYAENK
ncbi:MAG: OmpH family outer membrane protein [Marinilabiliaceae bacterium]|jgi:outer membrane protein|nr:OmpH family outer membrane protein [Marinilabiliaceae bacterium]